MDGARRKPYGSKNNNAHFHGAAAGASPGKRKGKRGGERKKAPIKVVYIGNPMRVTTSEAGFRALVQELTGRDADPSKYSGGGAANVVDADADADADSSGASQQSQAAEPEPGALPSPVASTEGSSEYAAAAAGHAPAPACHYYGEEEDGFAPQLIDNSYSVFSPPTFLSGGESSEVLPSEVGSLIDGPGPTCQVRGQYFLYGLHDSDL